MRLAPSSARVSVMNINAGCWRLTGPASLLLTLQKRMRQDRPGSGYDIPEVIPAGGYGREYQMVRYPETEVGDPSCKMNCGFPFTSSLSSISERSSSAVMVLRAASSSISKFCCGNISELSAASRYLMDTISRFRMFRRSPPLMGLHEAAFPCGKRRSRAESASEFHCNFLAMMGDRRDLIRSHGMGAASFCRSEISAATFCTAHAVVGKVWLGRVQTGPSYTPDESRADLTLHYRRPFLSFIPLMYAFMVLGYEPP
ncbi:hypothetical protein Bbelb_096450 [Branchiostoma belcheri]|nr:hypothetical protein Bbelb_096450 [Branchiostoma belcheri]